MPRRNHTRCSHCKDGLIDHDLRSPQYRANNRSDSILCRWDAEGTAAAVGAKTRPDRLPRSVSMSATGGGVGCDEEEGAGARAAAGMVVGGGVAVRVGAAVEASGVVGAGTEGAAEGERAEVDVEAITEEPSCRRRSASWCCSERIIGALARVVGSRLDRTLGQRRREAYDE